MVVASVVFGIVDPLLAEKPIKTNKNLTYIQQRFCVEKVSSLIALIHNK